MATSPQPMPSIIIIRQFTRDQNYFEANVARLRTPVKIVWAPRTSIFRRDGHRPLGPAEYGMHRTHRSRPLPTFKPKRTARRKSRCPFLKTPFEEQIMSRTIQSTGKRGSDRRERYRIGSAHPTRRDPHRSAAA